MPNTLIITRVGEGLFTHNLNGVQSAIDNKPNLTSFTSVSSGTSFLDFKTKNGAPLIQNQQIMPSEITITDEFGGTGTQTGYANVVDVWLRLGNLGYFEGFSGDPAPPGSNEFIDLLDVFPNSYLGQNNKVPIVNEAENRLEFVNLYNYRFLTQLEDVSIDPLSSDSPQVGKFLSVRLVNGIKKFTLVDGVVVNPNLKQVLDVGGTSTTQGSTAYDDSSITLQGGSTDNRFNKIETSSIIPGQPNRNSFIELNPTLLKLQVQKGDQFSNISMDDSGISFGRTSLNGNIFHSIIIPEPISNASFSLPTNKTGPQILATMSDVGSGGSTNLTYTASAINGVVNSDTGTDATLPAATDTTAGLFLPEEKKILTNVSTPINLGVLIDDNFNRASLGPNYTATGTASWTIQNNKIRVSGASTAGTFVNNLFNTAKVTNTENFVAKARFVFNQSTATDFGLSFMIQSVASTFRYSYYMLLDLSTGAGRGKLNVYSSTSADGSTFDVLHTTTKALTLAVGNEIEYSVTRNGTKYLFQATNNTTKDSVAWFMDSSLTPGFALNRIVNNTCKFGLSKQDGASSTATYDISYLNVERDLIKNRDFVFIGDSISFGYEAGAMANRFPDLIFSSNNIRDKHVVYAQPGLVTADYNNNLLPELSEITSKYAVVMLGMNEAQANATLITFQTTYSAFINALVAQGKIPILCLIVPNSNDSGAVETRIVSYNNWIVSNYGATYMVIDTFNPLKNLTYSGPHPLFDGHKDLGMTIYNRIKPLINLASGLNTIAPFISGSAILDFPETLPGNSSEVTFTVSGASEGDALALGTPNIAVTEDSCFTARVSANNTVTVKLNNYSAVAINPISATFKVKIFK